MSHTPGPWKIYDGYGSDRSRPSIVDSIPDRDGKCVANCIAFASSTNNQMDANAARIVACVNACEGINPEAVPEMLSVLHQCLSAVEFCERPDQRRDPASLSRQIRTLIAKAEATQCSTT